MRHAGLRWSGISKRLTNENKQLQNIKIHLMYARAIPIP